MSRPDARRLAVFAFAAAAAGCGGSTDRDVDALFAARAAGGAGAIPLLTRALADEDPRIRALAAWNLGELVADETPGAPRDDASASPAGGADRADLSGTAAVIVPLLRDPSPDVRAAALGALAGFPCRVPDSELAPMLRDAEAVVRLRAVELLSACEARVTGMEPARAAAGRLAALTRVLDDPDDDVREAIVRAIGAELERADRKPPVPAPPEEESATPPAEPGKDEPEQAEETGPPAPDPAEIAAGLERARDLVARLGAAALRDPSPGVRNEAAAVLAREPLPEAGAFLQLVTLDTQPLVRQTGRHALRSWEGRGLPANPAPAAAPPAPRAAKRPTAADAAPADSESPNPPEKSKPAEDDPLPAAGEGGTGRSSSR
jgi:HEAT repeat protein